MLTAIALVWIIWETDASDTQEVCTIGLRSYNHFIAELWPEIWYTFLDPQEAH